ncbi:MAG: alpha/beta hydrolase [Alphaproteobacteria bacterium]|nr:alpha/beta hydrolase [Alphaproteobacteria bacterium]
MANSELVSLDVIPGRGPRIYGALRRAPNSNCAALIVHPSSNFFDHYLMDELPNRGVTLMALNTRYLNNDPHLIFEHLIDDVGAGVRYLRDQGFDKIILLGNSGGASTVALYQAEAEKLTISDTPAGDPIRLDAGNLPPADGIALFGAHPGRSLLLLKWIDASLTDETDAMSVDTSLDIFNPENGPPFTREFVSKVRNAQQRRSERITERTKQRLKEIRAGTDGPRDEAFIVHRTCADPRFFDLSLDHNDREPGMVWGDPYRLNYGPRDIARFTTLTSWMSQWSLDSRAHGPECLARTSVPILNLEFTADTNALPSDIAMWSEAADKRQKFYRIEGATHFLIDQPALRRHVGEIITDWSLKL